MDMSGGATPDAPGQLKSHYAPRTPLFLHEAGAPLPSAARVGYLAFRELPSHGLAAGETLSPRGDLREAATTLFAKLRRLDESGVDLILAEPVPEFGLGVAIMDRLRKAAAEYGAE
jgi:L-threonylcarbamoyladenylate synthase